MKRTRTTTTTKKQSQPVLPPYIPQELYTEIFSKLPVKSLLRFRSVSKSWRSLIDNPNFISTHLTQFPNNSLQSHLFIIDHSSPNPNFRFSIRKSNTFRKISSTQFENKRDESYVIVGYVNGLLCLIKFVSCDVMWKVREILLWNPSIRKCVKLPLSPFSRSFNAACIESGFGYDPGNDGYKVVLIWYPPSEMIHNVELPVLVEVYATRTRMWTRRFVRVPSLRCLSPMVFFDGAIHWPACHLRCVSSMGSSTHIASFRVGDEVFSYEELPGVEKDGFLKERLVVVVGDCLGLLDLYRECSYVWVMEKGGGGGTVSWCKRYSIDLKFNRFLCFKKDGRLLFARRMEGVQSFDVETNEKKVLAKTFPEDVISAYVYVESLVLSTGMNGKQVENFPRRKKA